MFILTSDRTLVETILTRAVSQWMFRMGHIVSIFSFFLLSGLFLAAVAEELDLPTTWIVCWEGAPPADHLQWEQMGWSYQRPMKNIDHLHVVIPLHEEGLTRLRERDVRGLPPHQRIPRFLRAYRKSQGDPYPAFLWAEPVKAGPARTRDFPLPLLDDPLLDQQWHLHNRGQTGGIPGRDANIFQAWRDGVTGQGVVVGIVDEGIEPDHEDLAGNFDAALSYDFLERDGDPTPLDSGETHGVAVAGIVAAEGNDLGGIGVAYGARIASLRALEDRFGDSLVTTTTMGEVLNHQFQQIDIYNNSWGYVPNGGGDTVGFLNITASSTLQTALENGIRLGRRGLGSIYVWAAGNAGDFGGDVNHDQLIASPYTLAIGAVGDEGVRSNFSNTGAALFLTAPSSGNNGSITTLDLTGSRGVSLGSYRSDFGGTSAAAPIVAGAVALMLEANPNLTWRDVQEILARTAAITDPRHPGWSVNGAGFAISHEYGFGRLDTAAAVRLARLWKPLPAEEESMESSASGAASIPPGSSDGVTARIDVDHRLRLEHVQVSLELESSDWGAMEITLISPVGTESRLSTPFAATAQPTGSTWLFSTVRHRGELSSGRWRLRVASRDPAVEGVLRSWALMFRGAASEAFEDAPPIAVTDRIQTLAVLGASNVLQNDSDPEEEGVHLLSVERPKEGDAWIGDGGAISVQVDPAFRGLLTLPYRIADPSGNTARGHLEFINPRPRANPDILGALPGAPFWFDPLENDFDADGDPLQVQSASLQGFENSLLSYPGTLRIDSLAILPGTNLNLAYTLTDNDDGNDSSDISIFVPQTRDFALSFSLQEEAFARVPATRTLDLREALTLEAWIHPTGYGELALSGFGRIFDKEGVLLFLNQGSPFYGERSLVFFLRQENGSSAARYSLPGSIPLDTWTHVAVTYDGRSDVRFYLNGEAVPANAPSDDAVFAPLVGPAISTLRDDLYFGQNREGTRGFEGRLDELRIWERVRTPEEINQVYDRPLHGFEPGLVGYWPVIEARRNRLVERTGRSPHARFEGARWAEGNLPGLADDRWPEAIQTPEGWRRSEWFGTFFPDSSGWVFQERLGWVYPGEGSEASLFLFDDQTASWFWTSRRHFPYLYRYDRQAWVYFQPLGESERFFYDFATQRWESDPPPQRR